MIACTVCKETKGSVKKKGNQNLCSRCEKEFDTNNVERNEENDRNDKNDEGSDDHEETSVNDKFSQAVYFIVNELLAYTWFHVHKAPIEVIVKTVSSFYSSQEIEDAKLILWDVLKPPDKYHKRRGSTVHQKTADELNVDDIVKVLQKCESLSCMFVASDMERIPKWEPQELDQMSLVDRVRKIEVKLMEYETNLSLCRSDITDGEIGINRLKESVNTNSALINEIMISDTYSGKVRGTQTVGGPFMSVSQFPPLQPPSGVRPSLYRAPPPPLRTPAPDVALPSYGSSASSSLPPMGQSGRQPTPIRTPVSQFSMSPPVRPKVRPQILTSAQKLSSNDSHDDDDDDVIYVSTRGDASPPSARSRGPVASPHSALPGGSAGMLPQLMMPGGPTGMPPPSMPGGPSGMLPPLRMPGGPTNMPPPLMLPRGPTGMLPPPMIPRGPVGVPPQQIRPTGTAPNSLQTPREVPGGVAQLEGRGLTPHDGSDFVFPRDQRRKRKQVVGNASDSVIMGAPAPSRDLFVSRLVPNISVEDLGKYLKRKGVRFKVIVQRSQDDALFKSFWIRLNAADVEKVFCSEFWPSGVYVKKYNLSEKDKKWLKDNGHW